MTHALSGYSDQPTTHDKLGFEPSRAALLEIIHDGTLADTPLTIGIFGPWGSGKTSLMQMLLSHLKPDQCIPVWFNAWRYAQADALWRALLLSVVDALRQYLLAPDDTWLKELIARRHRIDPAVYANDTTPAALQEQRQQLETRLNDLVASLYRSVEREEVSGIEVNWGEAGNLAARTAVRLGLSFLPVLGTVTQVVEKTIESAQEKLGEGEEVADLFDIVQRQRAQIYHEQVRSLEQFHQNLEHLVKTWLIDADLRLVIFIDDLDRCLPEQAVSVLEAIKVFLDIQGCIFVLGVDREIIERGIRVRYKEFALDAAAAQREGQPAAIFPVAGRDYLEKIVQVPFELPPLEASAITSFLRDRLQHLNGLAAEEVDPIATVMTDGLQPNPRKVKRTLNAFRLLRTLLQKRGREVPPALLAKLVVIQSSAPRIYDSLVNDPLLLHKLDRVARGFEADHDLQKLLDEHPAVQRMLKRDPSFQMIPERALPDLIFLTRMTHDRSTGG